MLIQLTKENDKETVKAAIGDILSLALESNPTTGFDWALDTIGEGLLAVRENKFEAGESAAIGAGGKRVFRFETMTPGRGQIKLKYMRSWEGDGSIRDRFSLTIEVAAER
jgi:inhibitor of cysteine peptidase